MENKIIGIDNGNSNTKTASEVFVSGITKHDLKPPLADDLIEFNNKYYSLSTERGTYIKNKTNNENAFILTLFAIAKELLTRGEYEPVNDIDLAIGLPPGHYALLKDDFSGYFYKHGDSINFIYNGKPFIINIKSVNVFPQAYSAYIAGKSSVFDVSEFSRAYIIDIGGYTTDILLLVTDPKTKKVKPDLSVNKSLDMGIITMNNDIKERASTTFDVKIEDDHIYDVLAGRKTILSEKVQDIIREGANIYFEKVVNKIRELGIDLISNPAIFIGGGAMLLKGTIEKSEKVIQSGFITDISANARGFQLLNTAKLSRETEAQKEASKKE